MDRYILLASERTGGSYFGVPQINPIVDYPLLVVRDQAEMTGAVQECINSGLMAGHKITSMGWERIEALRKTQPDSRLAFVAMSFADDLLSAYTDGIKPGIEDTNYFSAYRLDKVEHNDKIDDHILADIRRAGLIVADFSHNRGSVYFEAGYALGLGIPESSGLVVSKDFDQIQFDTRQYPYIVWGDCCRGCARDLGTASQRTGCRDPPAHPGCDIASARLDKRSATRAGVIWNPSSSG